MSFSYGSLMLPAAAALAGTALLVVLHLLKVQPPRRTVATVMFWRQASREEHRRVLWGRFSRWRSFLLLLMVILLLSLALTGLRWSADQRGEPIVLVLDTSFSMSATSKDRTRLEEAKELAAADLERLGSRPVAVVLSGERPEMLVGFEQPAAVIAPTLQRVAPGSTPSDAGPALRLAAGLLPADRGRVLWYTDRPGLPQEVPDSVKSRLLRRGVGDTLFNAAILGVTVEYSDSSPLDCSIRVRVGAWGDTTSPLDVQLSAAGQSPTQSAAAVFGADGAGDALFSGLRADGAEYSIALAQGGALAEDDRASVRLPRRVPFVFQLRGKVPEPLRLAVAAMQFDRPGAEAATIHVGADPQAEAGSPAILVVGGSESAGAARVQFVDDALTRELSLEGAVCGTGTDLRNTATDLVPLIRAGESIVAAVTKDRSRLLLSDALFAAGSSVTQRPAFLVLLLRACRDMAGWTEPSVALPLERRIADPLWTPAEPVQLTSFPGGRSVSDLAVADHPVPAELDPAVQKNGGFPVEPWQIALAAALGLLIVEGLLQIKGRVV